MKVTQSWGEHADIALGQPMSNHAVYTICYKTNSIYKLISIHAAGSRHSYVSVHQ